MKNLLSVLLLVAILFSACKKDDDVVDPCDSITCLNGGTCNDGNCFCPGGWTGTYCETQVVTDPCAGVNCFNGGTCTNGNCFCPAGYTGNLCENQLPAQFARITKIECSQFPETNVGSGWDLGSGPDPYLVIEEFSSGTVVFTGDYYADIVGNPLLIVSYGTPQMPLNLIPTTEYVFRLYDWDGVNDDYMGGMRISFAANDGGFPSTLEFTLTGVTFKFYITWVH